MWEKKYEVRGRSSSRPTRSDMSRNRRKRTQSTSSQKRNSKNSLQRWKGFNVVSRTPLILSPSSVSPLDDPHVVSFSAVSLSFLIALHSMDFVF